MEEAIKKFILRTVDASKPVTFQLGKMIDKDHVELDSGLEVKVLVPEWYSKDSIKLEFSGETELSNIRFKDEDDNVFTTLNLSNDTKDGSLEWDTRLKEDDRVIVVRYGNGQYAVIYRIKDES